MKRGKQRLPTGDLMNTKPRVIILRTAGTNCDMETQRAFELAGADAVRVHVNKVRSGREKLEHYDILAIPGGFSYGDDIASGKILANEMKAALKEHLSIFAKAGKPIIGICNGFQVLVKMGLLPDSDGFTQKTTLTYNDSDRFECRWVYLKKTRSKSLWLAHLPDVFPLPVAHGEGKFVCDSPEILKELEAHGQIALTYTTVQGNASPSYPYDPNGSIKHIAGIVNKKGNILGLMPHPERFIYRWQHPGRVGVDAVSEDGWGLTLFKNAVAYCQKK